MQLEMEEGLTLASFHSDLHNEVNWFHLTDYVMNVRPPYSILLSMTNKRYLCILSLNVVNLKMFCGVSIELNKNI